jgi:hypothetical protein
LFVSPRCNGFDVPDAHVGAGDRGQLDGAAETLITLGIIVLEADLEFDGLEEVSLLGVEGVIEELLDLGTHSGCFKQVSISTYDMPMQRQYEPTVILDILTVFQ